MLSRRGRDSTLGACEREGLATYAEIETLRQGSWVRRHLGNSLAHQFLDETRRPIAPLEKASDYCQLRYPVDLGRVHELHLHVVVPARDLVL